MFVNQEDGGIQQKIKIIDEITILKIMINTLFIFYIK